MQSQNEITDRVNAKLDKLKIAKTAIEEEESILRDIQVANFFEGKTREALLTDLFKRYRNLYGE